MTDVVRLELPLPPSMNVYWRRGPNRSPKAGGAEPLKPKLTPEMEEDRERLGRIARLRRLGGKE